MFPDCVPEFRKAFTTYVDKYIDDAAKAAAAAMPSRKFDSISEPQAMFICLVKAFVVVIRQFVSIEYVPTILLHSPR
ncbi:hypothetical protein HDU98_005945, partial [Podochytrium sp. JEL0797]